MMKFHDAGYKMYSPPENIIYHLWERAYRKTFAGDNIHNKEVEESKKANLDKIRSSLFSNKGFLEDMKVNRGVDMRALKAS